jgi:ribosome-associated toxin RatA of RatAB toxin-antitoxin module
VGNKLLAERYQPIITSLVDRSVLAKLATSKTSLLETLSFSWKFHPAATAVERAQLATTMDMKDSELLDELKEGQQPLLLASNSAGDGVQSLLEVDIRFRLKSDMHVLMYDLYKDELTSKMILAFEDRVAEVVAQ